MSRKQELNSANLLQTGYVALGSNLATATRTSLQMVTDALELFAAAGLRITRKSRWYRAPAFPEGSGPEYVNGVVEIETARSPGAALAALHEIERKLGRTRPKRWASRVIDLDLLALGGVVRPDRAGFLAWQRLPPMAQAKTTPGEIVLPHPRLQDRAFVLKPLAEIAPDWVHPVTGRTAAAMLAALPYRARAEIRPL